MTAVSDACQQAGELVSDPSAAEREGADSARALADGAEIANTLETALTCQERAKSEMSVSMGLEHSAR